MTAGAILAQVGTVVVALIALYAAVVKSRPAAPEGRSASAAEVQALGTRLDVQAGRLENLERTNRALYAYIAIDHAEHRKHGWDVVPLPAELS